MQPFALFSANLILQLLLCLHLIWFPVHYMHDQHNEWPSVIRSVFKMYQVN